MDRFQRAFQLLAVHEGGYVNHPHDPGGATNKGVTQRTYDDYRRRFGKPVQDVRLILDGEVAGIYKSQYWNTVQADALPPGIAYCVFDAAVNSGPARAARWLQEEVGATVDGVIGNETLGKVRRASAVVLIDAYCDRRLDFMRGLRHWPTFRNGWTRRVAEVRAQSKEWAGRANLTGGAVSTPTTTGAVAKATGGFAIISAVLSMIRKLFERRKT